ncbi:hypothetical protein ADUPG1_007274 [Aduncisulcus paluster]|uniref:Uncharacterized protein n=1 Tax=Aduncisulcus paluster TaxID=2918883 RepID=A0ABQ5KLD3_9EUKA|nr:hypothetical protein ADUPG1_007274 [Aduncisulcus paluster]
MAARLPDIKDALKKAGEHYGKMVVQEISTPIKELTQIIDEKFEDETKHFEAIHLNLDFLTKQVAWFQDDVFQLPFTTVDRMKSMIRQWDEQLLLIRRCAAIRSFAILLRAMADERGHQRGRGEEDDDEEHGEEDDVEEGDDQEEEEEEGDDSQPRRRSDIIQYEIIHNSKVGVKYTSSPKELRKLSKEIGINVANDLNTFKKCSLKTFQRYALSVKPLLQSRGSYDSIIDNFISYLKQQEDTLGKRRTWSGFFRDDWYASIFQQVRITPPSTPTAELTLQSIVSSRSRDTQDSSSIPTTSIPDGRGLSWNDIEL